MPTDPLADVLRTAGAVYAAAGGGRILQLPCGYTCDAVLAAGEHWTSISPLDAEARRADGAHRPTAADAACAVMWCRTAWGTWWWSAPPEAQRIAAALVARAGRHAASRALPLPWRWAMERHDWREAARHVRACKLPGNRAAARDLAGLARVPDSEW